MRIFVINLPEANERRKFQHSQLLKLSLDYKIIDAISVDDIDETTYKNITLIGKDHYSTMKLPAIILIDWHGKR